MPQTGDQKRQGAGRTATREVRRQQLINATIESISKHGFSGTTLETVTKTAKLSHGVVNFHFDSKEDLYVETLGFLAREHYDCWHGAMERAGLTGRMLLQVHDELLFEVPEGEAEETTAVVQLIEGANGE